MAKTLCIETAPTVKSTPQSRCTERAASLYEQGYKASANTIGLIAITSPKGDCYLVNLDFETCTCQSFYRNLRAGNPGCKHIEGAELLLLRCERLSLTEDMILAIDNRNMVFTSELPILTAYFDNGIHQGQVRLTGKTYRYGGLAIIAKRMDSDTEHALRPEDVSVDGIVFDHLKRVAEYVARWHKAGPITGTYRQGNTRQWAGGGYIG